MILVKNFEKVIEKIIKIFVPIIFFIPLYVNSDFYFPFITPRNFIFRIIVIVLFFLYLMLLVHNKEKYKPKINSILLTYLAFIFILTISSLINGDFSYGFWGNYERMGGLINFYYLFFFLLIILGIYRKEKANIFLLRVTCFVSFIVAFIALAQYFNISLFIESAGGSRVSSSLGNPTYLATYSLFHLFFAVYLLLQDKKSRLRFELFSFYILDVILLFLNFKFYNTDIEGPLSLIIKNPLLLIFFILPQIFLHINFFNLKFKKSIVNLSYKLYFLAIILINFLALFYTSTRGALVGLFASIFLILIFLLFSKYIKRKFKYLIIILLFTFLFLITSIFIFKDNNIIQNNSTLRRISSISLTDATTESRLLTWKSSLYGFADKPVLGWGEEKFNVVFNKYFPVDIFKDIGSRVWFDRPHNIFLQHLIHGGILGLLAYFTLFVFVIKSLFKDYKEEKKLKELLIFGGLFIAYFVQNFFVFDSLNTDILFILFLVIIIFLNKKWIELDNEKKKEPLKYINTLYIFIILFFMLIILYVFNINQLCINKNFVKGIKSINENTIIFDKDNNDELIETINKSYLGKFEMRQVYTDKVIFLLNNNNLSREDKIKYINIAEEELLKSIDEQSDNIRHAAFLMHLYLEATELDVEYSLKNIDLINKYVHLSPERTQIYYSLGRSHMALNNLEDSEKAFIKAMELSPNVFESYLNLIFYYLTVKDIDNANLYLDQLLSKNILIKSDDYSSLAQIYFVNNYPDIAIDLLHKSIEVYPDSTKLLSQLIFYYTRENNRDDALLYLEKLSNIDSQLSQDIKNTLSL